MRKLTLAEAKQIDFVDYLDFLGHKPKSVSGHNYLYRSPLPGRDDKKPSFTVDRRRNIWYDHGLCRGGSIIDFGTEYYGCTISELLEILQTSFSFHRVSSPAPQQSAAKRQTSAPITPPSSSNERKKIRIVSVGAITSSALIHYLSQRKIPVELAQVYCQEVRYELSGKQYYAIGFANNGGGYELRNPYFKGGSSPKGITFFDNGAREITVFEGFFDFLSLLVLYQNQDLSSTNLLVLNSLSYFEKNRQLMEKHDAINLYLDRDTAGMRCTAQALKYSSQYKDNSVFYQGQKDLNQWLIQNFHQVQRKMHSLNRARELTQIMKNVEVSRERDAVFEKFIHSKTTIMTDFKRRTLILNSGKQIKLFGNSIAIGKSLQIGEGYAPNIFSCMEQQAEVKPAASQENKPANELPQRKTATHMINPYSLTPEEIFEMADYNIRLWLDLKDNIRRYGVNSPKVFNRDALL